MSDPDLRGADVVVVGSAPRATRPTGLDDRYRVITINASQQAIRPWGLAAPHAEILTFNQIESTTTDSREVRRVLRGERTHKLYMMLWRHGLDRLETGLRAFDYGYDTLELCGRYERIALVRAVTGELNFEIDASQKYSNGIIAVMLALHSGARSVIISGINPMSIGHAYNDANLPRLHVRKDMAMLQRWVSARAPVYTADPHVAETTGLPLWTGIRDGASHDLDTRQ